MALWGRLRSKLEKRDLALFLIAIHSGGITGFDPDKFALDASHFVNQTDAGHFGLSVSGNDLVLSYSAIPEPSVYAIGIAGLLGGAILFRRRRPVMKT